ncbi:MAG TPA: sigma-70 family RNA polymerase sigma factor [Acidobacteriaceae bacterium]|nr:sigma-70 family RNA polymerase sigma factor [Acidobacteriaceae bacterium]
MHERDWLAGQFEENRGHLRGVAYRMLGSLSDADDAVQESWLRLSRNGAAGIDNLGGWLTTVVAHVCLDMLRSRQAKREEPLESPVGAEPPARPHAKTNPENEAVLADSVGLALLVVLDRLDPAERLAFVLHDLFDLPFEEIAGILGRSEAAARQLASRARRRVRGADTTAPDRIGRQRRVVDAFLAALRGGDLPGLVTLLDPDFTVHADAASAPGLPLGARGPEAWAKQALQTARGAVYARPALVDGDVGIVIAPRGKLFRVLRLTITGDRIASMEVIGDPERLRRLDLAVLGDPAPR